MDFDYGSFMVGVVSSAVLSIVLNIAVAWWRWEYRGGREKAWYEARCLNYCTTNEVV